MAYLARVEEKRTLGGQKEREKRKKEREKRVFGDFRDSGILISSFFPTVLPMAYRRNIKY
jgi:hypothetical protein